MAAVINARFQIPHPYEAKIQGLKQNYDPDQVVKEIEDIRRTGQKICLFIGRTEAEPLPSQNGEVWVSGDIATKGIIPASRLHLWADFNDDEQLKRFYHLFDKVVIDQSTTKCLVGRDFMSHFVNLLHPSKEAEFIFEDSCTFTTFSKTQQEPVFEGYTKLSIPFAFLEERAKAHSRWFEETYPDPNQLKEAFTIFCSRIPAHLKDRCYGAFKTKIIEENYPPEEDKIKVLETWAQGEQKKHLEEYFVSVTHVVKQPFPYETRYRSQRDGFFVATGSKG